jgi:putative component of membrane protein insertase Oxa1/YidC/SpoIIIJ protein YidD
MLMKYSILLNSLLLFTGTFGRCQVHLSNEYGTGENGIITLYQKYISPVRGNNQCPMYPSCSQYAKIEFANKNPFIAYFEICDRLIRCGKDLDTYPEIEVNGAALYKDTVKETALKRFDQTDTCHSFVKQLEKENDYQSAILEYKRLIYYEKDSDVKIKLLFHLAICYYHTGGYNEYSTVYKKLLSYPINKDCKDSLVYFQSLVYLKQKNYLNAGLLLNSIKPADAKFKSDIAYLQGIFLLKQHEWSQAEILMKQVFPVSDHYPEALKCYNILSDYEKLPLKKPAVGLISSMVLPGSGYIYANRPVTGFTAMLLNGLFIWAASDAYRSKQYGIFFTASFIGIGWYIGTAIGSRESVIDFNNTKIDAFINKRINN